MSFVLDDGRRRMSRDELSAATALEAEDLQRHGDPESRFAVLADNGCGWAIADLALHAARRVNVPLPAYFTDSQLDHALDDAGVDLLLTDDRVRAERLAGGFDFVRIAPASGLLVMRRALAPERRPALHAGTTKITYTSGSTGQPKGVCLSADALETVARSLASVTHPLSIERHLCLLPLPTLLDNLAGLLAAPLAGAGCALPSLRATGVNYGRVDAAALTQCISRFEPGSMILVPELLRLLLAAIGAGWRAPASLRFVAVGGAKVAPELLERARQLGLPAYEGYGLSECASVVALNAPGADRPGRVGRVLPHARLRIDAHGEIHVSGATMLGYLGEAPAPAEIATGDLGTLDEDGWLRVTGRRKNLLITSLGRNVSPEWVESELSSEAVIGQACVLGDGRPWLAALLVPARPGIDAATLGAAVEAANGRLPDFARIRRWGIASGPFTFADGTATANGRLRRDALLHREAPLIDSLYTEALAS